MKAKKIRGHKRRWKDIDHWIQANKEIDLDSLTNYQHNYIKIRVYPWSEMTDINGQLPEPNGITKAKILNGLIEIYDMWKTEIEKLGEPYYLKIWLFEPRFSKSQVVCAIGEWLDFYESTFFKPEKSKEFSAENYGVLTSKIKEFNWEYRYDEEHLNNIEPGSPEDYTSLDGYEERKKWFDKMLKKPHRITDFKEPIGGATESYSFKKGNVWLGGK